MEDSKSNGVNKKEVNLFIKNVDKTKLLNNVYDIIVKFYGAENSDILDHQSEELLLHILVTAEDWKLTVIIDKICHIISGKINGKN